jgi:hypothetical protein
MFKFLSGDGIVQRRDLADLGIYTTYDTFSILNPKIVFDWQL